MLSQSSFDIPVRQPVSEEKLEFLRSWEAYGEGRGRVETKETHMSWLFFTTRHVYKLKKPISYRGFLDFTTLEARGYYCREEVRLNQRLASSVYLGVVGLVKDDRGRLQLAGKGEVVDWLVKMRRLPSDRMLDQKILARKLLSGDLERLGHLLVTFYKQASLALNSPAEYRERLERAILENRSALFDPGYGLARTLVEKPFLFQLSFVRKEAALLGSRAETGKVIEGHGDLRAEHICLESQPVIFDCLEFNRDFRFLDVVDELCFLSLDCERLGSTQVGEALLELYLERTRDSVPPALLDFYRAYRACLRAKLAIWHIHDLEPSDWTPWKDRAEEYLRLACKYAARA
ncbi:MAG: hypothetical protein HY645_12785 [Acidobacteria bacterium]|nr:hypothetical protein [Acidobacteriota bacterium]